MLEPRPPKACCVDKAAATPAATGADTKRKGETCPVHISLRLVAQRENDNLYLRHYAYHALAQRKLGVDYDLVPRTKPCLGWYSVDGYNGLRLAEESPGIVTFDIQNKPPYYNCPIKAASDITGGITLPLRWASRHGPSRGCLSIDFFKGEISEPLLRTVWMSALNLALLGIEDSGPPDALLAPGASLEEWTRRMFPGCDRVMLKAGAGMDGQVMWELNGLAPLPPEGNLWRQHMRKARRLADCKPLALITKLVQVR